MILVKDSGFNSPRSGGVYFMPPGAAGQHGLYRKEPISVSLWSTPDSDRSSDAWNRGLPVYGKEGIPVHPDEGGTHRSGPPATLGVFLTISINLSN